MSLFPLPASLDLSPHLAAHKYFFVCTLTVAAWDTLVLSPRTWRLYKTPGWPLLKILFMFLRLFMVAEFVVVGVAFFHTGFTLNMCHKFYLFEPICTAVLLAACSVVHVVRIQGIYGQDRTILYGLGALTAVQIVVDAICCAFFTVVPLRETQGCIAGPKHTWVGIYWIAPTLVYTASFALAILRSMQSIQGRSTNYWYLMLRDNLNVYGAIWIVNMVNVLFWFIIKPTGPEDSIRTIVTSMAAVGTTTMTLRIILGVRSGLESGGSFSGSGATYSSHTAHSSSGAGAHRRSLSRGLHSARSQGVGATSAAHHVSTKDAGPTFTLDVNGAKDGGRWADGDDAEADVHSVRDKDAASGPYALSQGSESAGAMPGVKVTVDTDVDYESLRRQR
jgi:hypothetical protein